FVPVPGAPESPLPLDDFRIARQELISEIERAPVRRVDNMITQAAQHAERIRMHVRIVDRARARVTQFRNRLYLALGLLAIISLAIAGYYARASEWLIAIAIVLGTSLIGFGLHLGIKFLTKQREAKVIDDLDSIFEEVYKRDLVVGNRPEDLLIRWGDVKPVTQR